MLLDILQVGLLPVAVLMLCYVVHKTGKSISKRLDKDSLVDPF